jgi:hypothetical protein
MLLEAPKASEAGAPSTAPLSPIWLAPPPNQEEWDDLRAVALKQQLTQGPEPRPSPRSRKRIAALVGALVSALVLTALLFGPIRKSAIRLSPFASASEKTAVTASGASAKELVVPVDSAVPPDQDQVSDNGPGQAADQVADQAPDNVPVAEAKPANTAVTPPAAALSQPVTASKPAPPSGTGSGGVHGASLKATAASWISACTDSKVVAGRILPAGGEMGIEFSRQARVIVGNAGGVQIVLDGKPLGSLGPEGKTRLVELTPSGFRVQASGALDGCGKE